MALSYTITDLPAVWPGKRHNAAKAAPFKSTWAKTLHILERELKHLSARQVQIAIDLPRGAMDLRQDGMLKADARPKPPVVVSFIDGDGQRQAYPCDRFGWWQDNLYAIAIVLEDLRRAERYGVQSSLIRAGFKALPSATQPGLSAQSAANVFANRSTYATISILADAGVAQLAYRVAAAKAHPDRGGSTADFQLVQEAKRVLEMHHGGAL